MTTLRAAAQQALEAMESFESSTGGIYAGEFAKEMADLRAALAEPQTWVCPDSPAHRYNKPGHCEDCGKTLVQVVEPVQEPKGYFSVNDYGRWEENENEYGTPLYTAPPQRKPLTDEEIFELENAVPDEVVTDRGWCLHFARAIEQAHGIKE